MWGNFFPGLRDPFVIFCLQNSVACIAKIKKDDRFYKSFSRPKEAPVLAFLLPEPERVKSDIETEILYRTLTGSGSG
jgi:hypothetical protein